MRLIDADELKKVIHSSSLSGNREWLLMDLDQIIDNAPTVEAVEFEYHSKLLKQAYQKGKDIRPQGEWIRTALYGETCYECNKCNRHQTHITKFCPNCGAAMKGGAE